MININNNKPDVQFFKVSTLRNMFENKNKNLIIDDSYQRNGDAWTKDKMSLLVRSIFENIIPSSIMLNKIGYDKYELMDGQQRTKTLFNYIANEFQMSTIDSLAIIEGYYKYFDSEKKCKDIVFRFNDNKRRNFINLKFKQLPKTLQTKLLEYPILATITEHDDRKHIVTQFSRLQNGMALTVDDNIHAVINELSEETKKIAKSDRILRVFNMIRTQENKSKRRIKDATRIVNSSLLEVIALKHGNRAIGSSMSLTDWVDKFNAEHLTENHDVMNTIYAIQAVFEQSNFIEGYDVGKIDIRLIFALISFGFHINNSQMDFDKFLKFVTYVSLASKEIDTYNTATRKNKDKETLDEVLNNYGLDYLYYNNRDLFDDFSSIRRKSVDRNEVKNIINNMIKLFPHFNND